MSHVSFEQSSLRTTKQVNHIILRTELAFGPPNARRYVIVNFERGEAWDGSGFVEDWGSAMKYAEPNRACGDMQMLLKQEYGQLPLKKYPVPLVLEVYGDASASVVVRWMHASTLLNVRTHEFGNGPKGSLICPAINWSMIVPLNESDYRVHPELQEHSDEDIEN